MKKEYDKLIKIEHPQGYLYYKIYRGNSDMVRENGFAVNDTLALLKEKERQDLDVIELKDMWVNLNYRKQGIAGGLIDVAVNSHSGCIVILNAGAHVKEYKEEPTEEEMDIILRRLEEFYRSRGFYNVNDYIGGYEVRIAMMYLNNEGKELVKLLEGKESRHENI